jgi:hypothetical protein
MFRVPPPCFLVRVEGGVGNDKPPECPKQQEEVRNESWRVSHETHALPGSRKASGRKEPTERALPVAWDIDLQQTRVELSGVFQ